MKASRSLPNVLTTAVSLTPQQAEAFTPPPLPNDNKHAFVGLAKPNCVPDVSAWQRAVSTHRLPAIETEQREPSGQAFQHPRSERTMRAFSANRRRRQPVLSRTDAGGWPRVGWVAPAGDSPAPGVGRSVRPSETAHSARWPNWVPATKLTCHGGWHRKGGWHL